MTTSGISGARRFYEAVTVVDVEGGYSIALDHRTLRTPSGAKFIALTRALAEACAEEWSSQEAQITPATMPLTQLAFAAIDWARPAREDRADFVVSYVQTDMCCHRAPSPRDLVARQEEAWQPIVDWAAAALGVALPVVTGVIPAMPPVGAADALRERALTLDDFRLTALTQATAISGSLLIGFAVLERRLDAEQAYAASVLDDLWALERWGEDAEARARLLRIRAEIDALVRFIEALS